MKHTLLVIATVLSMLASWYIGTLYNSQRDTLSHNLCLTDQAIVNVLSRSLASITKQDVKQYGAPRIRKARHQTLGFIKEFEDVSTCKLVVKIPRDPTR